MQSRYKLILIIGIFFIGSAFYSKNGNSNTNSLVNELDDIISQKYLYHLDDSRKFDGLVSGLMSQLDEYSDYFNPEDFADIKSRISGDFVGIGIEFIKHEDGVMVMSVINGGPAEKSGIETGDVITHIDNLSIDSMPISIVRKKLRGDIGVPVGLTIRSQDRTQKLVYVKRNQISPEVVKINRKSQIPIIQITQFNQSVSQQLKQALNEIKKYKPLGIILDLRNNPGGSFDAAIEAASILLPPESTIVKIQKKDGSVTDFKSDAALYDASFANLPIAVLINNGSASASEILAAAIIENNKGVSIGTKSFGKGVVQDIIPLESIPGAAVKITVAEYKTPKNNAINRLGIIPSFECDTKQIAQTKQDKQSCDIIKMAEKLIRSYY